MKKIFVTLAALFILASTGCDNSVIMNSSSLKNALIIKPATTTKANSFVNTKDGAIVYSIGSAFAGGAVSNPEKGSSHRCHFYQETYSEAPNWNEVEALVTITGFRYSGVNYTEPGQYVERIIINSLDETLGLGERLIIPLEQGKYNGGNPFVSNVQFVSYQLSSYNTQHNNLNKDANINIVITTVDGGVISILYENKITLYDGYY